MLGATPHRSWPMKLTFEVGNAEKHRIDFFWSQFWGRSFLAVDGTKVLASGITLSSPLKVIGKDDVASGWKARLTYALTRDGWPVSYRIHSGMTMRTLSLSTDGRLWLVRRSSTASRLKRNEHAGSRVSGRASTVSSLTTHWCESAEGIRMRPNALQRL